MVSFSSCYIQFDSLSIGQFKIITFVVTEKYLDLVLPSSFVFLFIMIFPFHTLPSSTGQTTLLSSLPFLFRSYQLYSCSDVVIFHFFCYIYIVDIHKLVIAPSSFSDKVCGTYLGHTHCLPHSCSSSCLPCCAQMNKIKHHSAGNLRHKEFCAFTDEGRQRELLTFL